MNTITRKGTKVSVEGALPTLNETAPDFNLENIDNEAVTLHSLKGKKVLISVFPDINTRICDMQTRHFFKEASKLKDTTIVNISNNTKDELKDWCAVAGVDAQMLSDTNLEFAKSYGLWIPELKALARAVFVVDANGTLTYSELVSELATEPNYEKAFAAVNSL